MQAELLKSSVKNLNAEMKVKQSEFAANLLRLEGNLKFSRDANANLKQDYDLLLVKFDKHMKASNNLNLDLKEELRQLNDKTSKLQIFYDDN